MLCTRHVRAPTFIGRPSDLRAPLRACFETGVHEDDPNKVGPTQTFGINCQNMQAGTFLSLYIKIDLRTDMTLGRICPMTIPCFRTFEKVSECLNLCPSQGWAELSSAVFISQSALDLVQRSNKQKSSFFTESSAQAFEGF
jgi:hypothetical protein